MRSALCWLLCWSLAAVTPLAGPRAAEWFLEGSANLTGQFDDNIRLRTTGEQAVFGAIFSPRLDIHGRSPLWDMNFITDLSVAQYTEDSTLNSVDPRLRLDVSRRTQLGRIRLTGEASRTSTLVTEATDTGAFETNTARNLFRLSPSWSYAVTPRDTITLGAGWTEALFESNALADYRNLTANAAWARQVTPADVISLNLIVEHFESQSAIDLHSNAVTALASWEHTFSERLKTSVAAGPQYFTTETIVVGGAGLTTVDENAVGYLVDASVDYRLTEQTSATARVTHRIEPTSGGSPLQRDKIDVSVRHQIHNRLWASLGAYYQQDNSPTGDPSGSRDRNYFSVEPGLTWALAENWDVSASYRFRTQNTGTGDRAFSNAIFATMTYRPSRWVFGH